MISNNIKDLIILYESKSSKRRGYVVKNITDTKTGKSKMIQVIRGQEDVVRPGSSGAAKPNYLDNTKIDKIYTRNKSGSVHPAIFHHEVGHIMRNRDPNINLKKFINDPNRDITKPINIKPDSILRQEKEAWQYVKQTKPEIYKQGLLDGKVQSSFGSYVKNNRVNHSINLQKNEINSLDNKYSKLPKPVANFLKGFHYYKHTGPKMNRFNDPFKLPEISKDHKDEMDRKGWNNNYDKR